MEREMYEAAMEGSVTSLLNLLSRDPLILDKCITACFAETPLHIAAMRGHLEFATELLKWKPELARELDLRKSTPLHLASAKRNVEMVKLLLATNPQMCHTCDERGWNPLHVAAMKGQVDALRELVRVKFEAAYVPIDGGSGLETILHLCVKHNQLEALKFLMAETQICDDIEFMNSKDGDGNTILHLAVLGRQFQTIDFLTKNASVDVNAKNGFGLTALDLLELRLKDVSCDCLNIGRLLRQAGATNSRSNVSSETTGAGANLTTTIVGGSTLREILKEILSKQEAWHKQQEAWHQQQEAWHQQQERNGRLESHKNAIMIGASLIAAAVFQTGANPPGGFWQGDSNSNHTAGQSVLADSFPGAYKIMTASNAVAFFTSALVFLLLLSGWPLDKKFNIWFFWVAMSIAFVAAQFSFVASTAATGFDTDTYNKIIRPIRYIFFVVSCFFWWPIGRFLVKKVWKKVRSSSSTKAPANRDSV